MVVNERPSDNLQAALEWLRAGCSVIPIRADGSKKPILKWDVYQTRRPTEEEVTRWFSGTNYGIAVVCGAVSGGLEMTELEARATDGEHFDKIQEVADVEFDNWDKWVLGHRTYAEHTPSGGIHLLYRIGDGVVPGNTKLANNVTNECLAETRGEGGYVIVAPTGGKVHSTGEDWKAINGCLPAGIKTIPFSLRNELHGVLKKALDERPPAPVATAPPVKESRVSSPGDETPGDHFERVASWAEILEPQGWTYSHSIGTETFWVRPGKNGRDGHSASTGHANDRDRLYVWSSSTGLDTETPLTKFYVWAHYNHGGDLRAAAADLRRRGFGTDRYLDNPDSMESFAELIGPSDQEKSPEKAVGATESKDASQERRLRVTPASAFRVKRVKWLWSDRAPLGEIVLIPGREGTGKSTLLAKIAAEITNGTLDGEFAGTPRNVLYVANEDSWEKTITPRMMAAGADLTRILRLDLDPDTAIGSPNFPLDCRELDRIIKEYDVAAVMFDPIVSTIDNNLDVNKAREVRQALEPLRNVLDRNDCTGFALVHFNKNTTGDVSTRIAGSRAFTEVARAVISVARLPREEHDPDEPDEFLDDREDSYVITQTKNNLGRVNLPHLTYRIVSVPIPTSDGEVTHIGRVEFTGESSIGVEEVLNEAKILSRQGENTQEVVAFIKRDFARTGMMTSMSQVSEAFSEIKDVTLRATLSRAVKKGLLESPQRGCWLPAGTNRPGTAGFSRDSGASWSAPDWASDR